MIALFSATGNSRLVAEALSSLLGDEKISTILTLDQNSVAGQNRIIWVFPVHAWGVPEIVEDAMEQLTFDSTTEHYLVATCGDDIGRTEHIWRKLLGARGGKCVGAFSIRMPNTYVLLPGMDIDSESVEAQKLLAAPARIEFIAKAIRHGMAISDTTPGAIPGIKSNIVRPFFRRFLMSPKPFHADRSRCKGCGVCVQKCPLGNITMGSDGIPVWGNHCATCLACYHYCVSHAVEYGTRTLHKGQYRAPSMLPQR